MSGRWFEPIAERLGTAYLKHSFTKGTEQEADFVVEALGLEDASRVLDAGCGPGRHAYALARRGITVVGADLSARFVELAAAGAPRGAAFVRADIRDLPFGPVFDAAICLCQGGFGLLRGDDAAALRAIAGCLRPGGRTVVSAFSAFFAARFPEGSSFDAATGVNHERATLKGEDGTESEADLWTTCFTPRELRMLAEGCGLDVEAVWSVMPGAYAVRPPDTDYPEYLVVARKPV